MTGKVWFITGASSGFGLALTEAALARGDRVAACARSGSAFAALSDVYEPDLLPIDLDVCSEGDVGEAMRVAADAFGRIDVVVSGVDDAACGAIEEAGRAHAREQFETNVFGTLWAIQAALPLLRKQGDGHILITLRPMVTTAMSMVGLYNATKAAVKALGESLAAEVAADRIKVTLVEPDGYGNDGRGSSSTHLTPVEVLNIVDVPYPSLRCRNAATAR